MHIQTFSAGGEDRVKIIKAIFVAYLHWSLHSTRILVYSSDLLPIKNCDSSQVDPYFIIPQILSFTTRSRRLTRPH